MRPRRGEIPGHHTRGDPAAARSGWTSISADSAVRLVRRPRKSSAPCRDPLVALATRRLDRDATPAHRSIQPGGLRRSRTASRSHAGAVEHRGLDDLGEGADVAGDASGASRPVAMPMRASRGSKAPVRVTSATRPCLAPSGSCERLGPSECEAGSPASARRSRQNVERARAAMSHRWCRGLAPEPRHRRRPLRRQPPSTLAAKAAVGGDTHADDSRFRSVTPPAPCRDVAGRLVSAPHRRDRSLRRRCRSPQHRRRRASSRARAATTWPQLMRALARASSDPTALEGSAPRRWAIRRSRRASRWRGADARQALHHRCYLRL